LRVVLCAAKISDAQAAPKRSRPTLGKRRKIDDAQYAFNRA
jgi:hypothetical protein